MTGDLKERSVEDIDAITLGYAEMKALATGNPVIIERIETDGELKKLLALRRAHRDKVYRMHGQIRSARRTIESTRAETGRLQAALGAVATAPQDFRAVFNGRAFDKRGEAGEAFMNALQAVEGTGERVALGRMRGFPVRIEGRGPNWPAKVYVRVAGVDLEVQPGQSSGGNMTRLMNAVDSIPGRIETNHALVTRMNDEIAGLEVEIARPFEREAEIASVQARLEELDAQIAQLEKGGTSSESQD
jgi:hypothetical protein